MILSTPTQSVRKAMTGLMTEIHGTKVLLTLLGWMRYVNKCTIR